MNSEPLARASDPSTSRLAGRQLTLSGVRMSQKKKVLEGLRRFPKTTSAELAELCQFNRYMVARRLLDLKCDGMVKVAGKRTCRVTESEASTWEVV